MPSSSVDAHVTPPAPRSRKRALSVASSVDQSLVRKRRQPRPSPSSNLWFDRLTPDLQIYLARFLSAGDSLGLTSTLLDVADASLAMRDAAIAALGYHLVLYYAAPHPGRWTALFRPHVRSLVYGDDWPGAFAPAVTPRPATLFAAPTLRRAEFNAEDADVLEALRASQSVRDVVVRVHNGDACLPVLDVLKTLNLHSVEVQCHVSDSADCPFSNIGRTMVAQEQIEQCCKGAKVSRLCFDKHHVMYFGCDSTSGSKYA